MSVMWNDTDVPIAILYTFRTYGTWLHGDSRGSVDRHNNKYGDPRIQPNEHFKEISAARLKHEPVFLDARRRSSVEKAIVETCRWRDWTIYAIAVRTNHAHIVTTGGCLDPDSALIALKANATRRMKEDGCWPFDHKPWAEKGSKRRLWNEKHIVDAADYVNFGQGKPLPKFE
jgi:REP element-mobilizing transposase RayT